jgi:hypothetical protein
MARGILFDDQWYEIDEIQSDNSREVNALMLIKMDKFNIGTANDTIKVSGNTQVAKIAAHLTLYLNEKEFGVHPRHLVGQLLLDRIDSKCYGIQPKRMIKIPVLTLAQFDVFKVYNKKGAATQANTTIKVNHSRDGSVKLEYRIIGKVDQVLI